MNIDTLIREIAPLYNAYQKGLRTLSPTELLVYMWDIGGVLEKYIILYNVAPHALYRDIYGKSEGSKNVKQRSYIPREFLGRSYRVKRIFPKRTDIAKQLPRLTASSHFREAMPFFDNPKYKLDMEGMSKLLEVINGPRSNKEKEVYVKKLQSEKIGKKNPRTQQLNKLEEDKLIFVKFYNDVHKALRLKDYARAGKEFSLPSAKLIAVLSLNCGAISADGLLLEKFDLPKNLSAQWAPFAQVMCKLIADENPKERRRFRRLIPPERMVRLSEMLYALSGPEKYDNYKL